MGVHLHPLGYAYGRQCWEFMYFEDLDVFYHARECVMVMFPVTSIGLSVCLSVCLSVMLLL